MASTPTTTSTVFFSVSMSLDGYIAPAGMDLEHADDPSYQDGGCQWALQHWIRFDGGERFWPEEAPSTRRSSS